MAAATRTVRVSPLSVERGEPLTVTGTGWARGATVELHIGPPRSEGVHVLLACRRECRVKATKSFRITR